MKVTTGVNRVVQTTSAGPRNFYFWYDVNGRILSDRYQTKMYHILDAVMKQRTNAALVIVASGKDSIPVNSFQVEAELGFIRMLLPISRTFLNDF
jgi:hypothetical protein